MLAIDFIQSKLFEKSRAFGHCFFVCGCLCYFFSIPLAIMHWLNKSLSFRCFWQQFRSLIFQMVTLNGHFQNLISACWLNYYVFCSFRFNYILISLHRCQSFINIIRERKTKLAYFCFAYLVFVIFFINFFLLLFLDISASIYVCLFKWIFNFLISFQYIHVVSDCSLLIFGFIFLWLFVIYVHSTWA